jgi:putative flippase GtrA
VVTGMIARFRSRIPADLWRYLQSASAASLVNLAVMALCLFGLGASAQISVAAAYGAGVVANFALNRQYVFVTEHGYALRLSAQGARFLVVAGVSYTLNAVALAAVPEWLGLSTFAVYLVAGGVVAVAAFLAFRRWVFHSRSPVQADGTVSSRVG